MRILPDYEHMEYRDVYTCRTYPAPSPAPASASVASTAEALPVGPVAQAGLLGFAGSHLLSGGPGAAIQMGWVSAAALGLGL